MATLQVYNKAKMDAFLDGKVNQFSLLTGATRATLYAKAVDGSNIFGTCTLTAAELPPNHTSTSERWNVYIYRHASNYGSIILISASNGDVFQSSLKNSTSWSAWARGGFEDNFAYTNLTRATLAQKGSGVYSYCRFTSEEAPKGSSGTSYSVIVMQNPARTWTNIWAVAQNDCDIYTAWVNLGTGTSSDGWQKITSTPATSKRSLSSFINGTYFDTSANFYVVTKGNLTTISGSIQVKTAVPASSTVAVTSGTWWESGELPPINLYFPAGSETKGVNKVVTMKLSTSGTIQTYDAGGLSVGDFLDFCVTYVNSKS